VLPKAQSREDIEFAAGLLDRLEKSAGIATGTVEILPMLESARGVMLTYEIASASPRVASVIIGSAEDADLMTDLGCRWSSQGNELLYARSRVLLEARAAGIKYPLDGVFPRINDAEAFVRDCELAKNLGYRGRTVIHPSQIEPANRVFSPTDKEIAYARDMLVAFDAAEAAGSGSLCFRGKMIDRAMVKTARELVTRFGT
jgi:citrate lyase subunit beta/citryl-CoA lyase